MRYGTGGVSYLSALINFLIYFAQMKDFRLLLKKLLWRRNNEICHSEVVTGEIKAYRPAVNKRNGNEMEDNAIELRKFRTFNPT